jgi:hypothetical protein
MDRSILARWTFLTRLDREFQEPCTNPLCIFQIAIIDWLEHASIWEDKAAVMSSVKNGYASIIKEYRVYELRA